MAELQLKIEMLEKKNVQLRGFCALKDIEISKLHQKNRVLRAQNEKLQKKLKSRDYRKKFSFESLSKNSELLKHYTGMKENVIRVFATVFRDWKIDSVKKVSLYLYNRALISMSCFHFQMDNLIYFVLYFQFPTLSLEDKIILSLMRLRRAFTFLHLGHIYAITRQNASAIFIDILLAMHQLVYVNMIQKRVPTLDKIRAFVPPEFKDFPLVKFLLDGTEFRIESPSLFKDKVAVYSGYYDDSTFKFLVACTPRGNVSFVSQAFNGHTSDKVATEQSNFLQLLNPGEGVMVDKGFLIGDMAKKLE
jgi:hypothetical protein